ncbi:response regulator [Halorientalis sp. IM1011]|uniref:response regulator transcription factor n=1 Tax=Halorientalis sp. IM1011 TaxID=1932360 RepID=UPI00097CCF92|nr:response regulator [Halorientalis sp. IM1011]AQL43590.1 response regulator [Halorientalis sp. IM1011]
MSPESSTAPNVLVVDDEEDVAEAYALKLRDDYDTELAFGGEAALEKADATTDAMLLDRRMPDIHGDEVLAELRDRGFDFPIIMVTAVDPDLNILEMDFDDYLCKPVDRETLRTTLDQHVDRSGTDPKLEEFFSLLSKLSVLESELQPSELEDHEEFQRLKRQAVTRSEELRESMDDFEEIVETHRSVDRGTRSSL